MILKEIKRSLMRYYLLTGIIYACIIGLYFCTIPIVRGNGLSLYEILIVFLISFVLCTVVFFVKASRKYAGVRNRVKYLQKAGSSIDSQQFTRISDELSLGQDWLVYHHDRDYRFWHRNLIGSIQESENDHPEVAKGILEIYSENALAPEAIIFTKNDKLMKLLEEWMSN
ncbi:MAG: hypothetical protein IKR11_04285 [Solobacterium sp.]|nr:hypothetical protein [Solobacterium sp.]